jgi:outer membrane protein assembly factor BamB
MGRASIPVAYMANSRRRFVGMVSAGLLGLTLTSVIAQQTPPSPRRIVRTTAPRLRPLDKATVSRSSWPSFRGPGAAGVLDGAGLPDKWDAKSGENILWRSPIPGLAHSSPIVWNDRVFLTSAISSNADPSFKPGNWKSTSPGDQSPHRWVVYAIDRHTGKTMWQQTASEGIPIARRHSKTSHAAPTPATDGRIVVASFGSQGMFAYDMNGEFRWKVHFGHLDVGAYDNRDLEWGSASSPIIWNDTVFLQVDTHEDDFLIALDASTGETRWKVDRDEHSSWGTPTVVATPTGPQLVTNAAKFIRAYDPRNGQELWRLGGSSAITAPTPFLAGESIVVASGWAPERPLFIVRPSARGDVTLPAGQTSSDAIVWSRSGRGPYMPTPLAYKGFLYVLANNGTFDAYDLKTGDEIYRVRAPHLGLGFSASPVAADGKIYISSEDGEMMVIAAGPKFETLATNSMGEWLMATPALSDSAMYVRGGSSLFAIGRKP